MKIRQLLISSSKNRKVYKDATIPNFKMLGEEERKSYLSSVLDNWLSKQGYGVVYGAPQEQLVQKMKSN